jgi:hypothetical protein
LKKEKALLYLKNLTEVCYNMKDRLGSQNAFERLGCAAA